MPRRLLLLRAALGAVLLAVALAALAPRPSVADADGTEARTVAAIDEILSDSALPSAFWGIAVQDLRTGRTLVSRNADKLLLPASNLKLFTTATALDALGPDFRYTTRLYHLGPSVGADGVMTGDLVIRGAGDPTFGSAGTGDPLKAWAEALAEAGVRRIEGRLIGDDDRFEDAPYGEGWDVSHIATESYAPATGGLAWADNLLDLTFHGNTVEADPPGFAAVHASLAPRRRAGLDVERLLGTDDITLRGGVPAGYRGTLRIPVANPTRYAVFAFADRLRKAGIDVRADLLDVDDLDRPPSYDGAEPLQVSVSPPLDQIITRTNRESDNLYAEYLLRTLAPDGSVDGGARRVKAFVTAAGADGDVLSIRDGSGLSRKDLVTPNALVALLRAMARHPHSAVFRASLPEGGGSGSTLRNRLAGVPVRAKTGSIEYVRCLAGYVTGPEGQPYAFALMANNYTTGSGRVAGALDGIVRALAAGRRVEVEEEP